MSVESLTYHGFCWHVSNTILFNQMGYDDSHIYDSHWMVTLPWPVSTVALALFACLPFLFILCGVFSGCSSWCSSSSPHSSHNSVESYPCFVILATVKWAFRGVSFCVRLVLAARLLFFLNLTLGLLPDITVRVSFRGGCKYPLDLKYPFGILKNFPDPCLWPCSTLYCMATQFTSPPSILKTCVGPSYTNF